MFDAATTLISADFAPRPNRAAAPPLAAALCAEAPRVRRLVHRLLGWRTASNDLDDVVQEVLLAAWRNLDRFRGDAKLATWLTRIAIRKTHNHVRSATLRRRVHAWFGTSEPAEEPESAGNNSDRVDATRAAMARLAHADREVLVLRYLEQREPTEIAQLLGCSRATVDTRLSRARRRLRLALGVEVQR